MSAKVDQGARLAPLIRSLLFVTGLGLTACAFIPNAPFPLFMALTLGAATAFLAFVLLLPHKPGSALVKAYFGILAVFHFGLLPSYLLTLAGQPINRVHAWIFDAYHVTLALQSCLVFIAAFVIMTVVVRSQMLRWLRPRPQLQVDRAWMYHLSMAALLLSMAGWFYLIFAVAGPSDYLDYIIFFERSPFLGSVIGFLHTAIAATFFFACLNARSILPPLVVYGLWSVIAFPLGLRGEVLFPLALTLPLLLSLDRLDFHWSVMAAGVVAALSISAFVATVRIGGDPSATLAQASPLAAIAELGGSLRPSYEVERWLHSYDSLRLGVTYYAPFERLFLALFPIAERLPGHADVRLMNVLIMDRAGPFGFSIVAESVINFGLAGAAAVGALLAVGLHWAAAKVMFNDGLVLNAAFLFGALIHVRQSFVSAFGAILFFMVIAMALHVAARLMRAVSR